MKTPRLFSCIYIWQNTAAADEPHLDFITKKVFKFHVSEFPQTKMFMICSKHIYFQMWITDCPVKMFWT